MKYGVFAAALVGLLVAVALVLHIGLAPVLGAVARVGFLGFAVICSYALLLIIVLGTAWYVLLADGKSYDWWTFILGRQVRDSASDVLPFSQLGGVVIGTRAITLRGVRPALAFASAVADMTTELMAQIVFIACGIALCITQLRTSASTAGWTNGLLIGTALMVPGVGVFVVLQRRGSALASTLAGRWLPNAVQQADAFRHAIEAIYASRARLAASAGIHLAGWFASGFGTWITLRLIGGRIDIGSAIAMEALLAGLRSAAVFVPSAIGVQEAGYAFLAPLFGLPPEIGLAASLLKRSRELTIGIPVLLAWQAMEGRRAFAPQERRLPEH